MNIYLSHASSFDYQTELYAPLKLSLAQHHSIFFPHETDSVHIKSKDVIARANIMLAEVSFPATGQGIEIGWADAFATPIVCFYRSADTPSRSLKFVTKNFIIYDTQDDMIAKLEAMLQKSSLMIKSSGL